MGIIITVTKELEDQAMDYAIKSTPHTSRAHDYHAGGPDNVTQKMFIGKLGEKAVSMLFRQEGTRFKEDTSDHRVKDQYDHEVYRDRIPKKVDVKTRTGRRESLLEIAKTFDSDPKDIYISARLLNDSSPYQIEILGYVGILDMKKVGKRVPSRYGQENYEVLDKDLKSMEYLLSILDKSPVLVPIVKA